MLAMTGWKASKEASAFRTQRVRRAVVTPASVLDRYGIKILFCVFSHLFLCLR
jgi:hypothetical protein